MDSWKKVTITLIALTGAQAEGAEYVRESSIYMTLATIISSEKTVDFFTPARGDALAFIGSDGDIRGAQFEQAVQRYRSTTKTPWMSDMQLAEAISATR
jgi:uncharacterized protein (TIGR02448 family)